MYLPNKYTTWYYSIISAARLRSIIGYTERHHIIPKSCGGDNSKDNIVRLTAKEHFICHRLLPKMTVGQEHNKMIFALHRMCSSSTIQERYVNPKTYETIRIEHSRLVSEMNKGRVLTAEHKNKIGKSLTGVNVGRTQSAELRTRRSILKTGVKRLPFTDVHRSRLSGPKRKATCPHCNKEGGEGAMKRWHFDNCRFAP